MEIVLQDCLLSCLCSPNDRVAAQEPSGRTLHRFASWRKMDCGLQRTAQITFYSSLLAGKDFVITVEDGNTYSNEGYITHSASTSVKRLSEQNWRTGVRVRRNLPWSTGAYHERGRERQPTSLRISRRLPRCGESGNNWQGDCFALLAFPQKERVWKIQGQISSASVHGFPNGFSSDAALRSTK